MMVEIDSPSFGIVYGVGIKRRLLYALQGKRNVLIILLIVHIGLIGGCVCNGNPLSAFLPRAFDLIGGNRPAP